VPPQQLYSKSLSLATLSKNFALASRYAPLNCWGEDSLSRIGSILGVPLYADECTTHQYRISFARLLIEMDVTKELPKEVQIEDVHGKVFKQQVMYDWTPPFCGKCKMVGHDCSSSWQPQPRSVRPAIQKKTVQKWVPKVQQNDTRPPIVTVVATPNQPISQVTDKDGWQVVARKTKEKGKSFFC